MYGAKWILETLGGTLCKVYGYLTIVLYAWHSYKMILNVYCNWKINKQTNKKRMGGDEVETASLDHSSTTKTLQKTGVGDWDRSWRRLGIKEGFLFKKKCTFVLEERHHSWKPKTEHVPGKRRDTDRSPALEQMRTGGIKCTDEKGVWGGCTASPCRLQERRESVWRGEGPTVGQLGGGRGGLSALSVRRMDLMRSEVVLATPDS